MRYLFYITENYSFEILRPLQEEIISRGHQAAWFAAGNNVNQALFTNDEKHFDSIKDAVEFPPDAVFVPGNNVPSFISGLKVQVFHGFEWKKKGHFRIRGFFDLYCTQGPLFTKKFEQLKLKHPHFNVVETGWPKMDRLFHTPPYKWATHKPSLKTILYAPTFSPSLTSAPALFDEISRLANQNNWQWLIKFHPKMAVNWIEMYKSIKSDNVQIVETETVATLLQAADVMVSDTSSIITEFALLNRPIVTFNNMYPEPHLINIQNSTLLESAIDQALAPKTDLLAKMKTNIAEMHPYRDGHSSKRILDAVDDMLKYNQLNLKSKPLNIWRQLKLRKQLSYWNF
jgi:hypothetical protein